MLLSFDNRILNKTICKTYKKAMGGGQNDDAVPTTPPLQLIHHNATARKTIMMVANCTLLGGPGLSSRNSAQ
ncbi:MAG: hypothetical protein WAV15_02460 [Minisyncoccia bacterium]